MARRACSTLRTRSASQCGSYSPWLNDLLPLDCWCRDKRRIQLSRLQGLAETNGLKKIVLMLPPLRLRTALHRLRTRLFDIYATKSYSQEGEDMILQRIFAGKERGFYVDVGAHHPRRFSNTYFFYRKGWSGINIEPSPEAVRAFQSDRKRDTNLQCGISDRAGNLTYYSFD